MHRSCTEGVRLVRQQVYQALAESGGQPWNRSAVFSTETSQTATATLQLCNALHPRRQHSNFESYDVPYSQVENCAMRLAESDWICTTFYSLASDA